MLISFHDKWKLQDFTLVIDTDICFSILAFYHFKFWFKYYHIFKSTVKLCYNDHGHNEFTFITNWKLPIWVPNDKLLRKSSRLQRIMDITNFAGPREFVTTEFDCTNELFYQLTKAERKIWPKNARVGSMRLSMKNLLDPE